MTEPDPIEHNEPIEFSAVFIRRSDSPDELLVRDAHGRWAPPAFLVETPWHADAAPLNDAVFARFGLRATTLRCERALDGDASKRPPMRAFMEAADNGWQPLQDARWAPPERGAAPAHIARALWSNAGWRDDALAWVRTALAERGIAVAGEPEQIKHWSIASIWRVPVADRDLWFKAVPPMFAHEGALLQLVAPSLPEHLPQPIAIDRARGWTLMEPLPPASLRDHPDSAAEDEAMRALATLQWRWVDRADALFVAGSHDRRLATLAGAIDEIVARDDVCQILGESDVARLRAFGATVPERIAALRACGVPETLVHGDFHAGNVAADATRVVIFDWTDGCVSHPFFDMPTYLGGGPGEGVTRPQAFLDAWAALLPHANVDRAWEIARPLACLHHAVSYMRILDGVEPAMRWEFDSDVTFWLRWMRDLA